MRRLNINMIVIHCSDTPNEREVSAADIHSWHIEAGWSGIGYHYVIRRDGMIESGRPVYWRGAHVRGYNTDSIGICLIGRDRFTLKQMGALRTLIDFLKMDYEKDGKEEKRLEILGHCDLDPKKTCPNFNVKEWWRHTQKLPYN